MPSLEFFVVASASSLDQATNRVSVFDILEDIQPQKLPAVIPRLTAVTLWILNEADQGQDFQASLRVSGPGLEEPRIFPQNFQGDGARHRLRYTLVNVPVMGPGTLLFELLLNGEKVASHQVYISEPDSSAPDDGFLVYPTVS